MTGINVYTEYRCNSKWQELTDYTEYRCNSKWQELTDIQNTDVPLSDRN